ncbi:MAG TPA: trehalose-phosphatase, partial [Candidatus Binataceae bacterium]|nr:trehalose-phosphatase [Candidatus Binataceae bacterium]
PLPRELLDDLLARGRLLLCLDFDGTISEITNDPWKAVPLPRAKDAIARLARHPQKLALAIISGRDLDTLLGLLGLRDGLLFAGTHGLEVIGCDGVRRFVPGVERCADDIQQLREFVATAIPRDRGFIVEDKRVALTLNYRNATPDNAFEALALFDDFVMKRPTLRLLYGKMIHEAIPRGIGGKCNAVEFFMHDTGIDGPHTVYFGDDLTDEDAFRALATHHGTGVLVGAARASVARFRLERPSDVAALLEELAAHIGV